MRRRSVCTAIPRTSSGAQVAGVPLDADVLEAVVVRRGSKTSLGTPADTTTSTWPAGSGSGMNGRNGWRFATVTSPSGPSHSPWVSLRVVPAGPDRVRHPAVDVLTQVDQVRAGPDRVTETGASSSTRRTGGAEESTSPAKPCSTAATWCQPAVGEAGRVPAAGQPGQVPALPRERSTATRDRPRSPARGRCRGQSPRRPRAPGAVGPARRAGRPTAGRRG